MTPSTWLIVLSVMVNSSAMHTMKIAGLLPMPNRKMATGSQAMGDTGASSVTVGPLNHDAWVNIVSLDRTTGALRAVTAFHFTPAREVTVTQQLVS